MKKASQHALEVEAEFLAGVSANANAAKGRLLTGTLFKREEHDFGDKVRAAMIDRRLFDRDRLSRMPHGRGFTLRGFERRFIFGKRLKSVTIATILAPAGPLLDSDEPAAPVTMAEVAAHVREVVRDPKTQTVVGVCSPSGFEEDVWNSPPQLPNVRVVLIAPRPEGGWRVSRSLGKFDEKLCRLFDPEGMSQKLGRVRRELEERSTDLLMGGVSAAAMARRLELPEALVQQAFEMARKTDPELRVSRSAGDVMLFRGAPVASGKEDGSMSLAEWIKGLFSRSGEEAKKINVLSERRAALSARLDRLYEDIAKLEKKEKQLLDEGKAATAAVSKRRVAGQVARMRKDISRCNTSATILSKQINIISTHIHNLELAQTGSLAKLPSSEELTEAAVNAEEILEQLTASDELVSGLDVTMAEASMSSEEADIMKELEGLEAAAEIPAEKLPQVDSPAAEPRQKGRAQAEG